MAEGSAAPSGAPAATAAATTSPTNESTKVPASGGGTLGKSAPAASAKAEGDQAKPGSAGDGARPNDGDDFEEVKIGHVSAKVPKEFAKTVKEVEKFAHSKAREVAELKRESESIAKSAKDKPAEFLRRFGVDPDDFSQAQLAEFIRRQAMSPEQQRLEELEKDNAKFKEAEADRGKREAADKDAKEQETLSRQFRTECAKALEQDPLIREDQYLAAKVVATKMAADKQKLGWTWDDCVAKVGGDFRAVLRSRASTLDPEKLEEHFGADTLKKWREFDVKRVTGDSASLKRSPQNPSTADPAATSPKPKMLSESEYRDFWARKAQG